MIPRSNLRPLGGWGSIPVFHIVRSLNPSPCPSSPATGIASAETTPSTPSSHSRHASAPRPPARPPAFPCPAAAFNPRLNQSLQLHCLCSCSSLQQSAATLLAAASAAAFLAAASAAALLAAALCCCIAIAFRLGCPVPVERTGLSTFPPPPCRAEQVLSVFVMELVARMIALGRLFWVPFRDCRWNYFEVLKWVH